MLERTKAYIAINSDHRKQVLLMAHLQPTILVEPIGVRERLWLGELVKSVHSSCTLHETISSEGCWVTYPEDSNTMSSEPVNSTSRELKRIALHALASAMIEHEYKARFGKRSLLQNNFGNSFASLRRELFRQIGACRKWRLFSDYDSLGTMMMIIILMYQNNFNVAASWWAAMLYFSKHSPDRGTRR